MIELISALKSTARLLGMTSSAVVFDDDRVLVDAQDEQLVRLVESFQRTSLSADLVVSSLTQAADHRDNFWRGIVTAGSIIVRRLAKGNSNTAFLIVFGEHEFTSFSEQQYQDLHFAEAALKQLVSRRQPFLLLLIFTMTCLTSSMRIPA